MAGTAPDDLTGRAGTRRCQWRSCGRGASTTTGLQDSDGSACWFRYGTASHADDNADQHAPTCALASRR